MNHLLITGATGMLGSYIMRDALLARLPLAVLVRPTRIQSAAERIEAILQYWESQLGRYLPRPMVLEGNLHQADLAINPEHRVWVAEHCQSLLHVAASVNFFGDERTGEPFLSNVDGTRHVLDFCEQVGIETFHHVSTAYVGGRSEGNALEMPIETSEADFRCDYEHSKALAEELVRNARMKNPPTFFRPSIIVGDSQTGFTSAYQSIYTALRLGYLHLLANRQQGWELDSDLARRVVREQFIQQMGMTGSEKKNLVPVDWVSAAIVHCVQHPQLHGQIYHLTNPQPTAIEELSEAMLDAVLTCQPSRNLSRNIETIPPELLNSEGFREQMSQYRVYFEEDAEFERTHCQRALPDLPCPVLDRRALVNLWTTAIEADFVWRPPLAATPKYALAPWLAALPYCERSQVDLQLQVSGPGGGTWQLAFQEDLPVAAAGRHELRLEPTAYFSSQTLARLWGGELTLQQSVNASLAIIPGGAQGRSVQRHLRALFAWLQKQKTAEVTANASFGNPAQTF